MNLYIVGLVFKSRRENQPFKKDIEMKTNKLDIKILTILRSPELTEDDFDELEETHKLRTKSTKIRGIKKVKGDF